MEKVESKYAVPIIKPPRMRKCFPATLKLKNRDNQNKPSNRVDISQDFPTRQDESSEEIELSLAKQLDQLISENYDFVDIAEDAEIKPLIEVNEVDHTISLYVLSSASQQDPQLNKIKPKRRLLCEEVTYEDLRQVAVTGDWVLNKCGVYGKGRERLGELVTGAEHSPKLKKQNKQKKKTPATNV